MAVITQNSSVAAFLFKDIIGISNVFACSSKVRNLKKTRKIKVSVKVDF